MYKKEGAKGKTKRKMELRWTLHEQAFSFQYSQKVPEAMFGDLIQGFLGLLAERGFKNRAFFMFGGKRVGTELFDVIQGFQIEIDVDFEKNDVVL